MSWLNSWSETVNKRMCRFLLHRYLGQVLRDKLCLEQLTVDVFNGTGAISELMLDVEWINGQLSQLRAASPNLPNVRLIDGYVGKLSVCIPWQNLLGNSCTLCIDRLEVTIGMGADDAQSAHDFGLAQATSLVDSFVGSMASSVQLAKSILSESGSLDQTDSASANQTGGDSASDGVEAFAQIIEAVLARLQVTVNKVVVRLEAADDSHADESLATAVEIRVDRCTYVDEQVEKASSAAAASDPAADGGARPSHTLHSVEGLSKLLHLHGVRLYTDVFTRPSYSQVLEDNGAVCTSMYIRRKQKSITAESSGCTVAESMMLSDAQFVSCYSHVPQPPQRPADIVGSRPVLLASLGDEKQTVRFRLRNEKAHGGAQSVQIDIELFLGALYALAGPSQIGTVAGVLSGLIPSGSQCGDGRRRRTATGTADKAMGQRDYTRVEELLLQAATTDDAAHHRAKNAAKLRLADGNWSAHGDDADHFYTLTEHDERRARTNLAFDGGEARAPGGGSASQIQIRAKVACVLAAALCDEPNGSDELHAHSQRFFEAVNDIEWNALANADRRNALLSDACSVPHLRLYTSPLAVDVLSEESPTDSTLRARVSSARAALSELVLAADGGRTLLDECPVLRFDADEFERGGMDACFQCEVGRNAGATRAGQQENGETYSVKVQLAPCKVEVDMSMVDRIAQLLAAPASSSTTKRSSCDPTSVTSHADAACASSAAGGGALLASSLSLRDDLFSCGERPADAEPPPAECAAVDVTVKCDKLTIDLRIPQADLSELDAASACALRGRRLLHDELLRFRLDGARVRLCRAHGQQLGTDGALSVHASRIIGWLCSATGRGPYDEMPVLQAANNCAVSVEWDVRDKSLGHAAAASGSSPKPTAAGMHKSMWSSYFGAADAGPFARDGGAAAPRPFSKRLHVYDGEVLTLPGASDELAEFKSSCVASCQLHISFSMDKMHLLVPDKKFYEVLYNRLANDLALWQPMSSRCRDAGAPDDNADSRYYYSIHANVHDGRLFAPCTDECDDDDGRQLAVDGAPADSSHYTASGAHGRRAHNALSVVYFELSAKCGTAVLFNEPRDTGSPQQLCVSGSNFHLGVQSDAANADDDNGATVAVTVAMDKAHLAQSSTQAAFNTDVTSTCFGYANPPARSDDEGGEAAAAASAQNCLKVAPIERSVHSLLCNNSEQSADGEHALTAAVTLHLDKESNTKNIVVALAVRNSLCFVSPLDLAPARSDGGKIWLAQIIDLFDVTDYPVAGYTWPKIVTELHVQLDNIHVQYEPASPECQGGEGDAAADSPCVRLGVDSAHFAGRLVPHSDTLTLRCMLEDSRLYAAAGPHGARAKTQHGHCSGSSGASPMKRCESPSSAPAPHKKASGGGGKSVHFDKLDIGHECDHGPVDDWAKMHRRRSAHAHRHYVCAAHMGLLDVKVTLGPLLLAKAGDDCLLGPASLCDEAGALLLDIAVSNDQLTVAACGDTVRLVGRVIDAGQRVCADSAADTAVGGGGVGAQPLVADAEPEVGAECVPPEEQHSLHSDVEERLKIMVQSAMRDQSYGNPCATVSREAAADDSEPHGEVDARILDELIGNCDGGGPAAAAAAAAAAGAAAESAQRLQAAENRRSYPMDDEFCIVDEIPGSGVTCPSGEPRVRCLLPENERQIDVNWSHFAPVGRNLCQTSNGASKLPVLKGYARPLVRYTLDDFSLAINMYGGADFEASPPVAAYSQWSRTNPLGRTDDARRRHVAAAMANGPADGGAQHAYNAAARDVHTGGVGRDASVLVELNATKLCIAYEMFAPSESCPKSPLSRCLVTLADLEAKNHLKVSKLRKIVHQCCTEATPRRTCAPIFCVKWLESCDSEYKVKMSALPLRINLDQDTLEFVQDFVAPLSSQFAGRPAADKFDGAALGGGGGTKANHYKEPVMQVPQPESVHAESEERELIAELERSQDGAHGDLASSVVTVSGLFDAADDRHSDAPEVQVEAGAAAVRFRKSPPAGDAATRRTPDRSDTDSPARQQHFDVANMLNRSAEDDAGSPIYISSFTFSPPLAIRLDYAGGGPSRVTVGGANTLHQLLVGLANIHCAELVLAQLEYRHGILGVDRLIHWAINQWLRDIAKYQLPQVVGSIGPLSALAHILRGVHSLFTIPANEWRAASAGQSQLALVPSAAGGGNVRLARAVRKGALTFGTSTATGVLQLVQGALALVQGAAEIALDIVSPDYARLPGYYERQLCASVYVPSDVRQGVDMASAALRQGVVDAAQLMHTAAQEDRASGRLPLRGLLRLATPAALRPIVLAGRATGHLLAGVHAQLQPDYDR